MNSRPTAVANLFYSGDAVQLQHEIQSYLGNVPANSATPKAIISPHAGYIYSGQTAAFAYAPLKNISSLISRVVILGPCHRVPLTGIAAPSVDYFETPLGHISLDKAAINSIIGLPQVHINDEAHRAEHSLEVQLPFLQEVLGDFSIIPLVVGRTTVEQVSQLIEMLWGGSETLIVISSDLSHFKNYDDAITIDTQTCAEIVAFDNISINHEKACGCFPIKGFLNTAKSKKMKVTTLDLRNSGDTAGTKDRVVGYGAWIFEE